MTIKVLEQIFDDGPKPSPKGAVPLPLESFDGSPDPLGGLLGNFFPVGWLEITAPAPNQRKVEGIEPLPCFGIVVLEPKEQGCRGSAGLKCHVAHFTGCGKKWN